MKKNIGDWHLSATAAMSTFFRKFTNVRLLFKKFYFLFRWRKSIYKALWSHVLMYTLLFYGIGLTYKLGLNDEQKRKFENLSLAFSKVPDLMTLVFVLGFIATQVMTRWFAVHATIPGTGKIITSAQFYVKNTMPNRSAFMRTLTRFILLSWLLFMRQMCRPMARRFPTLHSIHRIGLILRHEAEMLERMARFEDKAKMSLYVINWAIYMVREAKDQGHFEISNDVARVLDPILAFKKSCSSVLKFKETEFPQSFLQLMTLMVFAFGAISLIGMQFVDPEAAEKVLFIESMYYVPFLPTMQYVVILSWLLLCLEATDSMGDDDIDFNMLIVLENHVEAADNLLRLYDQRLDNPTGQSLDFSEDTLFQADPFEKDQPMKDLFCLAIGERTYGLIFAPLKFFVSSSSKTSSP